MEKYNTIWDKFHTDIKKKFNSKTVYNQTFLKIKIKFYGDEATDFHNKELPKTGSDCTCLAVVMIDLLFKKTKTIIHKRF